MTRSDRELLAAHVAGDRCAFGELFDRHRHRLWCVARQTARSDDDADDALMAGIERAFKGAGTYKGRAEVKSWLARIITNAALDQFLKSPKDLADTDPADLERTTPDIAGGFLVVKAALDTLPAEHRAAFFLVSMRGFTQKEAAVLLEVPHTTIKTWVARARVHLVEHLDEDEGPAEHGP